MFDLIAHHDAESLVGTAVGVHCQQVVRAEVVSTECADRQVDATHLEIFTNVGIGTMVTQDGLIRLGSRVFSREEGIPPSEYDNGEFGWTSVEPPAKEVRL